MRLATLTAAAALLIAAGAAHAQSSMSGMSQPGMSSSSMSGMAGSALPTPDYLTAASQSDQFEIQEGQLAQTMGKSSKVKAFGKEMVRDHTKSTKDLMAAATKAGMTPAPAPLRPDQQQMIAALQATSGADFDRTYIQQQTQSHQEALQVHQGYAQGGSDKTLKAAAAKIVPVVQSHLNMLQSMQSMAMN